MKSFGVRRGADNAVRRAQAARLAMPSSARTGSRLTIPAVPLEVNEQGGDVGRADSADPAGLAERERSDALELLAGLGAKLGDRAVVEIGGDRLVLEPAKSLDLLDLATDVAVVLGLDRRPDRSRRRRSRMVAERWVERDRGRPRSSRGAGGSGTSVSPSTAGASAAVRESIDRRRGGPRTGPSGGRRPGRPGGPARSAGGRRCRAGAVSRYSARLVNMR